VTAPDGDQLTPEEWEAVRRLRGERKRPAAAPEAEQEPAAAEAVAEEPSAEELAADALEPRPAPRIAVVATTAVVVLAVAAVALLAVVTAALSGKHDDRSQATAALSAATSGVGTVLSYNYKSLDEDFRKAESVLTPSFRKTYDTTTAKAVKPLAAKYQAVSTAQATGAGVVNSSATRAQVIVFVSQQVTNSQLSAPRLDRSRIVVDLKKIHGRWLIDKLTPV
jgi:Mce-associated membrane protein